MNSVQYRYRALVLRVVDADTVDLSVDLGFRVRIEIRTRLYGIDAPELYTAEGKAARDWLQQQLLIGTPIEVDTYKNPLDKYGRWLATLWLGTRNLNEELLALGHAKPLVMP